MKVLEIATLLGSKILEKHFTHDKTLPGNDHYHAMDKTDLKNFITNLKEILDIIGDEKSIPLKQKNLQEKCKKKL